MSMKAIVILLLLLVPLPAAAVDTTASEDAQRYGIEEMKKQRWRAALRFFTRAVKLGEIKGEAAAGLYLNRGITLHFLGKFKKAIADYNLAIKLKRNYGRAYNNRGWAYEKLGQRALAIRDYRRALAIDPKLLRPRDNLIRLGEKP
jgi:tetratricopeptide (TPR) repeat protein